MGTHKWTKVDKVCKVLRTYQGHFNPRYSKGPLYFDTSFGCQVAVYQLDNNSFIVRGLTENERQEVRDRITSHKIQLI